MKTRRLQAQTLSPDTRALGGPRAPVTEGLSRGEEAPAFARPLMIDSLILRI